jgi:hypothetical protein
MKMNEGHILLATTTVFVANKLAAEHLAKLSPERSPQEWERHFKHEAAALIASLEPECLDTYLQERFPH